MFLEEKLIFKTRSRRMRTIYGFSTAWNRRLRFARVRVRVRVRVRDCLEQEADLRWSSSFWRCEAYS